jgi:hypothetical protein
LLCGAVGHAHDAAPVWHFGAGGEDALDQDAAAEMAHLGTLFRTRAWHRLEPDASHSLLVEGTHEGGRFAAAARAADGSCALVYVPTPRTLTLGLSRRNGRPVARWLDPTDGMRTDSEPLPVPERPDLVRFTPPRRSAAGEQDSVLVLDAAR